MRLLKEEKLYFARSTYGLGKFKCFFIYHMCSFSLFPLFTMLLLALTIFITMFCDEIYITMKRILGKYITLGGDLNFEDFKLIRIHLDIEDQMTLSDVKNVFSFKNLIRKPNCFKSHDGAFLDSHNFEKCLSECHKQFSKSLFQKTSTESNNLYK